MSKRTLPMDFFYTFIEGRHKRLMAAYADSWEIEIIHSAESVYLYTRYISMTPLHSVLDIRGAP